MTTNERKQIDRQGERQRLEKRFQRRLTTLSWTLPVVAFGSFFSVWHDISAAVNPTQASTTQSTNSASGTTRSTTAQSNTVLFKVGTRSAQVATIQAQLQALGYFNHVITTMDLSLQRPSPTFRQHTVSVQPESWTARPWMRSR